MIAFKTLIILTLAGVIRASFFHPSNAYDYSQRTARHSAYAVNLPLYQRIAAVLSNTGAHHDSNGCLINHPQDPEQGEVVQSAAYPQVTLYHSNYQQPQWSPIAYNSAVGYNQAVPYSQPVTYNTPVAYPHTVAVNRIRAVQRVPLGYPIPTLPVEGVPSVNYGYQHPSAYSQPLY